MGNEKWDEDFDPDKERNIEDGLGRWEGVINVVKGCLGTGLLVLPQAFSLAGTLTGVVIYMIIGVFGTYCFHLLLNTINILCKIKKVGFLDYGQALTTSLEVGPKCTQKVSWIGGPIVDICMLGYQTGALSAYIIFMSENLKMICDQYFGEIPLGIYMFAIGVPTTLLCLIPNMKMLTPVSMFANIVSVLSIGVILWYSCRGLPDFNSRPKMADWRNFPLVFGTTLFSLLSVPVIITVQNHMKKAEDFVAPFGSLNVGFFLVSVLYILVGLFGFWKYGDDIKSSITLNFPEKEILSQTLRIMYVIAICITYALNLTVPRDILWFHYILPKLKEDSGPAKLQLLDTILRLLFIVFTYIIALTVPLLGLIISIVGGMFLSFLGVIFPALMEICVFWPNMFGRLKWMLWKDILIILIGFFIMITNVHAAIRDIIIALTVTVTDNPIFDE